MSSLKYLLCLLFMIGIYSCDPEELPQTSELNVEKISADTGNQENDPLDKKKNGDTDND